MSSKAEPSTGQGQIQDHVSDRWFEDAALAGLRLAAAHATNDAGPLLDLGDLLRRRGRVDEAIAAFRGAVEREPLNPDAHHVLGSVLGRHGLREAARAHYLEALRLNPGDPIVHSSLLYLDGYDPGLAPAAALRDHVWWDRLHGRGLTPRPPHANDRSPDRPLRIGYVSPDFREHPIARFTLPIYAAHDRAAFQIWSYARAGTLDAVAGRFKAASDGWRNTAGLSDDELAHQIRADEIDVLVDLSGHTGGNRLGAFALQPAPVQVSYLGYPRTTGLGAIRYRLTDRVCDPPGEADCHTEELVRLPGAWCCWEPQAAPPVAPPPCLANGYVTFGSMHNVLKINDGVLDLWARVLNAVPRARLRIHRNTMIGATREHIRQRFAACGIELDRIELGVAGDDGLSHLALYGEVDLSLDAQPWSAHTTTCESLWMGVPMLTERGTRAAGRQSASVLETVGLGDLIAETADGFVALAAAWAAAPDRLEALRGRLRDQVRRSPLCDGATFTRGLEDAYRTLWRRWCASDDSKA